MIESDLPPEVDGTGEGYGNYPGLTVAQVAERYRHLAEEGHNRSVRAILRIAHEQVSARGTLIVQRYLVAFGLVATLTVALLRIVATPENHAMLTRYLLFCAGITVLVGIGAMTVERTARRNFAQVREIRRLALLALERVVEAPDFSPKPLEREHLQSLREMRKVDPKRWERVTQALSADL